MIKKEGGVHYKRPKSQTNINQITRIKIHGRHNKHQHGHKRKKPMSNFTIQDQIEHVLGVAMAQVYSLKKGPK